LSPEPLGNVKEQDIAEIWNSPRARGWRKRIEKLERCQTCQEPGAIRYSAFIEGLSYLRFLVKSGKHGYEASFYGEGYSKYAGELR
jgi:MoaA/NifB/PqqE/SkfB family radical SAM enzyme